MTREEAIKVLTVIKGSKEFIQGFGTKYNNDIEAIDMAIESLSAEPNKSRPYGDCAKCIHEYGTLGCCTTVSNEWVYDCDNGMAQYEKTTAEPSKSAEQNVADVPIDDLVSRAEVLALINKAMFNTDNRDIQDYIFNGLRRDVHNLPSADRPTPKQTDTLIIADALRYLIQDTERHELDRTRAEELREQILKHGASMCSSADRPKGEWIVENHEVVCSVCGQNNLETNFCPNCGADMRGEK